MNRAASAPEASDPRLVAMRTTHLDAVMRIEVASYPVPWTRGNFIDSLAGGSLGYCLFDRAEEMLGYCVAMAGPDELHLLNLTVAAPARGRGHARLMLDHLVAIAIAGHARQIWLEVRTSNQRALHVYRRFGFSAVGVRKAYYPAAPKDGTRAREDAIAMSLELPPGDR